jgi:ankyrin repeat protein
MLEQIAGGRTDAVIDFLGSGNPADAKDGDGVPLIRWCAYYGDVSAIRFLLAGGESLESLGQNFDLNGAAFHGHWQLCQFLIEQGADVDRPLPGTLETPLHAAFCKPGQPVFDLVAKVLLAAGADPNLATAPSVATGSFMRDCRTKAETALHRAAACGSADAIQMLLDAGAAVDSRDMNGDSPLSWASWHQRPAHVLAKLCFGKYSIDPAAVRRSEKDAAVGWRGMQKSLAGSPTFRAWDRRPD